MYTLKISTEYGNLDKETLRDYLQNVFQFAKRPELVDPLVRDGQAVMETDQPDGPGVARTVYTLCDDQGNAVGSLY